MNMPDSKPLVSIGMPTYNGEQFLRQTLDSLLAQDYENFELIISDNASTDRTAEICQTYVTKDKRIRYYRNQTNLGAVKNVNRLFELSSGDYFMMAADHDIYDTSFISSCVEILIREPSVVVAYPQTQLIDLEGTKLEMAPDSLDTRCMPDIFQRFHSSIRYLGICTIASGLIRSSAWKLTRGARNTPGPDRVFMSELSLIGTFAQIPQVLFYLRGTSQCSTRKQFMRRQAENLDPNSIKKYWTPYLHQYYRLYEFLYVVYRSKLGITIKTRMAIYVIYWFVQAFVLPFPFNQLTRILKLLWYINIGKNLRISSFIKAHVIIMLSYCKHKLPK